MKILFLNLTQGLVDRGMERVVDLYATALSKKNQVMVVQAGSAQKNKKYQIYRTYPLITAPQVAPNNILEKLIFRLEQDPSSIAVRDFTYKALKKIQSFNPDVVIACNGAPQIKILKKELPMYKIAVFGAAGLGHHDIKTISAKPDLYIAMTQAALNWAKPYLKNTTLTRVIPNPVVLTQSKKRLDLALPHPVVLTVGALTAYKHIVEVAEALSDMPVSHVIIGDGTEVIKLQKVLSQRAYDFRWIKQVDPTELGRYYAACDVFCFTPDPREAFGNVYIEAMASSLPIVATDDPVRREIIGERGYFVDYLDQGMLREAVVTALENGRVDYGHSVERYNVVVVAKQLEDALYDLIN